MVEEKVREGYKRTEVGVIPEEWEIRTIGREIASLDAGVSVNSIDDDINNDDYAILKTSSVYNGKFIPSESKKIRKDDVKRAKLSPKKNSLIISRMNTPELVGECGYVDKDYDTIFLPDRLWQTSLSKNSDLNCSWLNYILNTHYYRNLIKGFATGTSNSMKNISKDQILSIKIPYPNATEQLAISTTLLNIDKLLQSLEKLIEKKKKIKQGTIQQLLTGKKRLSGFSDEWEVKKLIELGYFVSGNGFPIIYQELNEGEFPFYKVSDFNNIGNEIYMIRANNYIDEQIREKLSAKIIPKNSIIFAKIGAAIFLERKRISSVKCCIDNNMMSYICDVNYLYEKFAYYLYNSIKLSSLVSATALPSLSAKDIGELKINIPINIDEQKAIANILTVMDSEIATLQQKLEKYKRIKQGMMQELLTGRIRLI